MSRPGAWTSSDVSWRGGTAPYDLVKEAVVAVVAAVVLVALFALLFSSPDPKPVTVQSWAKAAPSDFVTTAAAELAGTSGTATYGPPYTNGAPQHLGFFKPAKWVGVQVPIDTAKDFVLAPLRTLPSAGVGSAVALYGAAPPAVRSAWTAAYAKVADHARIVGGTVVVPSGRYGPVPALISALYGMAANGSLDAALQVTPQFYNFDQTKRLLFLGDGSFLSDEATAENINGDQWGIMNEVGQWPGAWWLFPYTAPYQVKPGSTSPNADLLVFVVVGGISLLFILLPWIPGLRDIPRLIPVHRLIWREHYRRMAS
jgi:hypothetical protein